MLSNALVVAPAFADADVTEEQIIEQDHTSRGLWEAFQAKIAGVRVRASEDINAGSEYDDTGIDWVRTGLSIDGGLPIPALASGLGVSISSAVVVPVVHGSSELFDLPGATDDPLDDLLDSSLGTGVRIDLGSGFALAVNSGFSARHEIGADLQSALAFGSSFGVNYRRDKWLRLQLGVGLGTSIDRANLSVSPVIRIKLRPMPGLWLEAGLTGGQIDWQATDRFELILFGGVDSTRYRLSNRGGSVGAGSLELATSQVGIGLRTRIGRHFRIRAELGVLLGQHLSILDDDGNTVDAKDTNEPSAAIGITIEWQSPRTHAVEDAD